jgi:hypothetical protein
MSHWIIKLVFVMWREIAMFRHAELCFMSRGIELKVYGLSRLRFFTRTETKQIRKGCENSRTYELQQFFRCNLETGEYEWEGKRKEVLAEYGQTLASGREHLACESTRRIQNSAWIREISQNVRALANGFATAAGGGEQWQVYTETPTLSRSLVHGWCKKNALIN